jgi:hypothetical protein
MFYMGHFSFRESGNEIRHGNFTVIMKGDGVDKTLGEFSNLLKKLQEKELLFHSPATIYLDAVTKVKAIPEQGLMAHMISRKGELGSSISISLPDVSQEYAEHFGMVPEPSNGSGRNIGEAFAVTPEMPEPDEMEVEPFLSFES